MALLHLPNSRIVTASVPVTANRVKSSEDFFVMDKRLKDNRVKVFYRPIEAAIRWSELLQQETHILKTLTSSNQPRAADVVQWPDLGLNIARLFDGLVNGELPYGENGVTQNDPVLFGSPDLTIRHLDLKKWMGHYYPEEKPAFLFSEPEPTSHLFVDIDTVRILLIERDGLKAQLQINTDALQHLRREHQTVRDKLATASLDKVDLHPRGETTYLHIIGGLLSLLLNHSPGGKPYSVFKTQESIIDALMGHHAGVMGINERTLQTKFAEANRRMATAESARP